MTAIEINSSLIMGCITFLFTFTLVIISYIFLFKRQGGTGETKKNNETVRETAKTGDTCQEKTGFSPGSHAGDNTKPNPSGAFKCPFSGVELSPSLFENFQAKLKKTEKERKQKETELSPSVFDHIPAKVKKTEKDRLQQEVEKNMTDEDRKREREIQLEQMRQIYQMMQGNEETFGISDMKEMNEQMKLYM